MEDLTEINEMLSIFTKIFDEIFGPDLNFMLTLVNTDNNFLILSDLTNEKFNTLLEKLPEALENIKNSLNTQNTTKH